MAMRLESGEFMGTTGRQYRTADFVVSESRYAAGVIVQPHEHSAYFVCVVMSGAFTEHAGRRADHCKAGMMLVRPAGEVHSEMFERAGTCLNLQPRGAWLRDLPHECRPIAERRILRSPAAFRLAQRIRRELREQRGGWALAVEGWALLLVSLLAREAQERSLCAPAWIIRTVEQLNDAALSIPSIRELAASAGVHPVHFSRVFKRHMGCTPSEHLCRLRVQRAAGRLRDWQVSIARIAHELGFCDQAHLTHAFRRVHGITPAAYRASLRKGDHRRVEGDLVSALLDVVGARVEVSRRPKEGEGS
jgi:AraC family transcriptional regulator